MTPLELYHRKLQELLDARDAAGGELSMEEEYRYTGELEDLWRALSKEERDAFEAMYGDTVEDS